MTIGYPSVVDHELDYTDLVFTLEKHICADRKCLKLVNNQRTCKYGFPKPRCHETIIEVKVDRRRDGSLKPPRLEVSLKRENCGHILTHNRDQLVHWRGNCDWSPLFDLRRVIMYVNKYANKAEEKSSILAAAFASIFGNTHPNVDTVRELKRVFTKVIAARDVTTNEAIHALLGINNYYDKITIFKIIKRFLH